MFEIIEKGIKISTKFECVISARGCRKTNSIYSTHIKSNMYCIVYTDFNEDILIKIKKVNIKSGNIHNDFNVSVEYLPDEYIFNHKNMSISKINLVKTNLYKIMKNPPCLIGGLIGGGTSYVAKLLKYSGLFLGEDSGDMSSRKSHESLLFKDLEKIITTNYAFTMDSYYKYVDDIEKSLNSEEVYKVFKENLEYRFSSYIGNINNIDKIWGWKYPSNNMLSKYYKKIWPDLKIIIIRRNNVNFKSSDDGTNYIFKNNMKNRKDLIDNWLRVEHIDEKNKIYIDFEKICTDYKEYNILLNWIGLNKLTEDDYNNLLKKTKIEKDKI